MPIPAGVVGDLDLSAVIAAQYVTAQLGRTATLNGRQRLELKKA
jgi:hypothetical protein